MKYTDYLKSQIVRAESKWARKPGYEAMFQVKLLESINRVKDLLGQPTAIGCMGVRSGTEMFVFKNAFRKCVVDGVDITENIKTIRLIPGVYVHLKDFNNLPKEWEDKFDLLFSNSIDHAYKIEETIKEWQRVTKPGGKLMIQFSTTRANTIEHTFKDVDIKHLFKDFKCLYLEPDDEDLIMGVFENEL